MKNKLKSIKDESQRLCSEISSDMRAQVTELESIASVPFKNIDEFDSWFYSDKPLVL